MPVKMDWDNTTTMISSMGMDWEDPTTDIAILDLPSLEFTATSECDLSASLNMFEPPASPVSQIISHDCMWSGTCGDPLHPGKPSHKGGSCCMKTACKSAASTQNATQKSPSTAVKLNQIPAGRSLLLSSRNGQNPILKPVTNRDKGGTNTRPDTPLSLDDESPEFKHHIDLAGSITGPHAHLGMAQKPRERGDSQTIINIIKEHLEDNDETPKNAKILDLFTTQFDTPSENVLDFLKYLSDYEEANDDESEDSESDYSSTYGSSSDSHQQGVSSGISCSNQSGVTYHLQSSKADYQETSLGDHSYTRPKDRFDTRDLGVQTPSDSEEEEIDVGSVPARTLPTNPSARDRRALQTTVAHKISARMVKTQKNGIRTIPPRRPGYSCDEYSSTSSTPTKVWNAHQTTTNSRKRPSSHTSHHSSKKHRGKKQKTLHKRNISDSDEAETLEKRNLHNDMERQRRIGLKNLFEELKATIPSIKDKERAPKVNILREAALLCTKLNRDDQQYLALKKQNSKLIARLKQLKSSMANSSRRYVE